MALKKGTARMVERRDILKTSLTLCSCAASEAVGIGGLGRDVRADDPTPSTARVTSCGSSARSARRS
jgi:hypothetical protein